MSHTTQTAVSEVTVKDAVVARALGEEMVLLDLDSGLYYSLNTLGAFIWALIERGLAQAVIADAIMAEYDVTPDVASSDLAAFLHQLHEWGLVTTR